MAAERLSMRKIREVLRLHASGLSHREIGRSLRISHNTVATYLRPAGDAGLSWPLAEALDDGALGEGLFPPPPPRGTPRELRRNASRSNCSGWSTRPPTRTAISTPSS